MTEHTENASCSLSAVSFFAINLREDSLPRLEIFWERENKGCERGGANGGVFFWKKGVGRDLINFEGSSAPFVRGRAGDGGVSEWVERV